MTRSVLMALVAGLLLAAGPVPKEDAGLKEVENAPGEMAVYFQLRQKARRFPEDVVKILGSYLQGRFHRLVVR